MTDSIQDTQRAIRAAQAIIDGRNPVTEQSKVLVTTEHAIATVLLTVMGDPRKAAAMLNEGLIPGIENRLALYASKGSKGL